MKFKLLFFGLLVILGWSLVSCETDFDTTAKYKDITVVYGIIDQKTPVQYIKINKAFLSETDVLTYATDPDSNLYLHDLEVWIEEWTAGGDSVRKYDLSDTTIVYGPDGSSLYKEPGLFYNTEQVLYKWTLPQTPVGYEILFLGGDTLEQIPLYLNDNHIFKLKIRNPKNGKLISSETPLVKKFDITDPRFGKTIQFLEDPVQPKTFSWIDTENAGKFEFELKFNFRELNNSGDTIARSITLTKATAGSQSTGSEISVFYWDDNFYNSCISLIPYQDVNRENQVVERYTDLIEIIVKAAEEDFALYLDVNEPSSSIVQDRPQYTNVENGIGIFSSRNYRVKVRELTDQTVSVLQNLENPDLKFKF